MEHPRFLWWAPGSQGSHTTEACLGLGRRSSQRQAPCVTLEQARLEGPERQGRRGQVGTQRSPFSGPQGPKSCSLHVADVHKLRPQLAPCLGLSQLLSPSPLTTFLGPSLPLRWAPDSKLQRPRQGVGVGSQPLSHAALVASLHPCPDAPPTTEATCLPAPQSHICPL